ncbi:hypothetical protein BC940DRAFT_172553 [Gongronella butleri]|nr:hypothetical protein BC940DRAFT_172553 [Gongronella butleri]
MEDIAQELEGLIDQLGVVGFGTQLSQWVHQLKQGKDSCSQNMDKLQQERRALIETLDDLQTDLVTLEAQYTTTANGHDLISLHDTTDALKNNVTELEQKCLGLETQRTQLEQRLATLKRMGDPDASAETDRLPFTPSLESTLPRPWTTTWCSQLTSHARMVYPVGTMWKLKTNLTWKWQHQYGITWQRNKNLSQKRGEGCMIAGKSHTSVVRFIGAYCLLRI